MGEWAGRLIIRSRLSFSSLGIDDILYANYKPIANLISVRGDLHLGNTAVDGHLSKGASRITMWYIREVFAVPK